MKKIMALVALLCCGSAINAFQVNGWGIACSGLGTYYLVGSIEQSKQLVQDYRKPEDQKMKVNYGRWAAGIVIDSGLSLMCFESAWKSMIAAPVKRSFSNQKQFHGRNAVMSSVLAVIAARLAYVCWNPEVINKDNLVVRASQKVLPKKFRPEFDEKGSVKLCTWSQRAVNAGKWVAPMAVGAMMYSAASSAQAYAKQA